MRRIKGFTLLESLIVLTIFITLAFVGSIQLDHYRQELLFAQSITRFKSSLMQAGRRATITHDLIRINHKAEESSVVFEGTPYLQRINLDEGTKMSAIHDLLISRNGMISPKTVTFSDGAHEKTVKIQMTWGRMIDEEKD